jgi:hypothetical protein
VEISRFKLQRMSLRIAATCHLRIECSRCPDRSALNAAKQLTFYAETVFLAKFGRKNRLTIQYVQVHVDILFELEKQLLKETPQSRVFAANGVSSYRNFELGLLFSCGWKSSFCGRFRV